MSRLKAFVISAAVMAVSVAQARAADISDYRSLPSPAQHGKLQREELFSGWYLRGDLGYRLHHIGTSSSGDTAMVPNIVSAKFDNTFIGGVGAGYKAGWFRAEVTGDYGWRSNYNATAAGGGSVGGKVDSFTVMANGYVDLGTWAGITPYVGAGIGGANLVFSNYENSAPVAPMPSTAVPYSRWNLAWAAMAGLSYGISQNLLLDLGYRHVDMGDIGGGPYGRLTVKHLTGDEVRLGFRYMIN